MNHYSLSNSTGKETGRTFPQLHCLTQPYAHAMSSWEFPGFKPKLIFELQKTAKLTDVLSNAAISASGFLISSKVKDILDRFNLMKHKYYDASIVIPKTGETLNYHWLHLCQPELINQLDYEKSVFYETRWEFREDIIKLTSYKHYEELKELRAVCNACPAWREPIGESILNWTDDGRLSLQNPPWLHPLRSMPLTHSLSRSIALSLTCLLSCDFYLLSFVFFYFLL